MITSALYHKEINAVFALIQHKSVHIDSRWKSWSPVFFYRSQISNAKSSFSSVGSFALAGWILNNYFVLIDSLKYCLNDPIEQRIFRALIFPDVMIEIRYHILRLRGALATSQSVNTPYPNFEQSLASFVCFRVRRQ
jgi:hypothetical protein